MIRATCQIQIYNGHQRYRPTNRRKAVMKQKSTSSTANTIYTQTALLGQLCFRYLTVQKRQRQLQDRCLHGGVGIMIPKWKLSGAKIHIPISTKKIPPARNSQPLIKKHLRLRESQFTTSAIRRWKLGK